MLLASLLGVIVGSAIAFLPYSQLKSVLDYLTVDGNLESFTPGIAGVLRQPGLVGFIVSLLIAGLSLIGKRHMLTWMSQIGPYSDQLLSYRKAEIKELWKAVGIFETDHRIVILLATITLLAALIRIPYLWRPMGHDEAYTFIAFASRGLRVTMTDYHLPNNHVFHTILVFIAYRLFGDSPAAIRLPAFLAGALVVPASFVAAKIFFDKATGLISASILASIPVLIDYSTNARSYSLIALLFLVLVIVAAYIKDHVNLIAWVILVVISSVGMYANPTMAYPIGVVFCWLLICAFFYRIDPAYGNRIYLYLFLSVISIGLISGLLYTPIILYSGVQSLVGNNVIAGLTWSDFFESVPVRIRNTWNEWYREIPSYWKSIGLFGLAASIFLPFAKRQQPTLLLPAAAISIGAALLVQRVAPWPRVWLFLLPLITIWIVAGLLGLFRLILGKATTGGLVLAVLTIVAVLSPLSASTARSYDYFVTKTNSMGEIEEAAVFLSEFLEQGDVVVVTSPDTVILDYYLRRRGIDRDYLDISDTRLFRRAIILVNSGYSQTLESVLIDRSFEENVDIRIAQLVYQSNRITLYLIPGS